MTIDVFNHIGFMLFKLTLVVLPILALLERSRNTSAANLHGFLLTLLVAIPIIPVAYFLLPNVSLPVLEGDWIVSINAPWQAQGAAYFVIWLLIALYGIGVLVKTVSAFTQWLQLQGIKQASCACTDLIVLKVAQDIRQTLGVRSRVKFVVNADQTVPITWGLRQPYICLPKSYIHWGEEKLTRVLTHEMAHIKRKDAAVNWVMLIVGALLWCVPSIRWVTQKIEWYREVACDDLVLASGVDRTDYAQDLLEFSQQKSGRPVVINQYAVALMDVSVDYSRIHTVLDGARVLQNRKYINAWFALVVAGVFGFIGVLQLQPAIQPLAGFTFVVPAPTQKDEVPEPTVQAPSDPIIYPGDLRMSAPQFPEGLSNAPIALGDSLDVILPEPIAIAHNWQPDTTLNLDVPYELVHYVHPAYPKRALAKGLEAQVYATFDILPSGAVTNVRLSGSNKKSFNMAVRKAVEQFVFHPRMAQGKSVATYNVKEVFNFQIKEGAN